MRILIAEDDPTSRLLLRELLKGYGTVDEVTNGRDAEAAVQKALAAGARYDLVCLDIMMPEMDGHATLHEIRIVEEAHGVPLGSGAKVIMTTALGDKRNVMAAFAEQCDAYLVKPVEKAKLLDHLRRLGLIARRTCGCSPSAASPAPLRCGCPSTRRWRGCSSSWASGSPPS
jgi:two-component system chemotaxis response regulator CheY